MFSYAGTEDKDDQGYLYATGAEVGQSRLGTTMWERPDVYLASSSVFTADQATTPILLYNSYSDYRVPFGQSLELFKALRRLGKPAWLLQSGEGHCGGNYGDRLKQFFAHYLKGEPAPRWMTRGVPARKRGTDPGLDVDSAIVTPGAGIRFEEEARTPEMEELAKFKKSVEEVLRRRWD